jgi:hypothetical protein
MIFVVLPYGSLKYGRLMMQEKNGMMNELFVSVFVSMKLSFTIRILCFGGRRPKNYNQRLIITILA